LNNTEMNNIAPAVNNLIEEELASLRASGATVQRIRVGAQRELEFVKQTRAVAEQYQRETAKRVTSQAQLLILQARLTIRKEIAELKAKSGEELQKEMAELMRKFSEELAQEIAEFRHKAGEEQQKLLTDIRMIRTAAHEELQAQRRFVDAARINALSPASQEEAGQNSGNEKEAIAV